MNIFSRSIFFLFLFVSIPFQSASEVKKVHIPKNFKVEKNIFKETTVSNLSEVGEIFISGYLFYIDGFLYMSGVDPVELVKISLDGKIVGRISKKGQGPGEFIEFWSVRDFKGNLALLDFMKLKIIIFKKNLEFVKEIKLTKVFFGFLVDNNDNFVFYGGPEHNSTHYFEVYSSSGQFRRKFGRIKTSLSARRKKKLFDQVRFQLYVQKENGIWASFKNRYDLRYYENKRLVAEIRGPKNFFKGEENNAGGRGYVLYVDRSVHIAKVDDRLYYFYRIDKQFFCDIFDLKTFQLRRRIILDRNYRYITHSRGKIFYALGYNYNKEYDDYDLMLFRLKL
jgi:6-bladed beta-propeller